ncbi:MAG: SDR family oxidoreductase [Prosthecobacter sp.]
MSAPSDSSPRGILITGANGVLGHALAHYFLQKDPACHLFLGVRRQRERVEALQQEHPGRVTLLNLDVTQPEAWEQAVTEIEASGTPLLVLVNNAGHHDDTLLAQMSWTQWQDVIQANLGSVFLGCRAVQRSMMKSRFGRIINIASLSAFHPPVGQTNYAAAKAGVIGLTKSLAKETARLGITVNAVAPAHLEGATPAHWTPEQLKAARMQTPQRRFARPDEVAAAVFFLASPEAAYITGTTLHMDGGLV